jgi:GntR family transcriptional regulator/MocR family aminotransferase
VYIGTFSQSLAPALRVGFLVAPRDLVDAFHVAVDIGGHGMSAIEAGVLADFIDGMHLSKHLRVLRAAYRERQSALVAALADIGGVVRIEGLDAGTHLVAHLRPDADDIAISAAAARLGIEAPTLQAHAIDAVCPPALVLGYGSVDAQAIRAGARLLAKAIELG